MLYTLLSEVIFMAFETLKKCNDERGPACFAYDHRGRCKCLGDTRQVPCPFYKPLAKVLEQDPNYGK